MNNLTNEKTNITMALISIYIYKYCSYTFIKQHLPILLLNQIFPVPLSIYALQTSTSKYNKHVW